MQMFSTMLLSGSPHRLPPGSAGHLCAGVYILLPLALCVRGSAFHPAQGTEVYCCWSPSVPCMWVFHGDGVFASACLLALCFITADCVCSSQACPSWSQLPSTQTASILMRVLGTTATATSWHGSPSVSPSSLALFTLRYARNKDTRTRLQLAQMSLSLCVLEFSCWSTFS